MNIIYDFSNNPDSIGPEQMSELNKVLVDTIKKKIINTEKKYNIKFKFPKNICDINVENKMELKKQPLPMIYSLSNQQLVAPMIVDDTFDYTSVDSYDNNSVDNLTSCMKIVNSVKKDLEKVNSGIIKKENVDDTFFTWIDPSENSEKNVKYESELDEMYEKKFGNKAILKNLIEQLKYMI